MKILILVSAGLLACSGIVAQKSNKRTYLKNTFGIRVAYNNTTATNEAKNVIIGSLNRYQAGAFWKYHVLKNWFVKTNLIYSQKGNFYDDDHLYIDGGKKVSIRLDYIEASIEAGYAFKIGPQQSIQVALGPYLAKGIKGTEKGSAETIYGRINIDKKIDLVNSQTKEGTNLKIKPIDAGLNFFVAYQYKKYGVFVNYGLGLVNRENWGEAFNRVASAGVSYSFR